jgi:hypothetical protein
VAEGSLVSSANVKGRVKLVAATKGEKREQNERLSAMAEEGYLRPL